jgi:transcriptional regulator with XRE-family HTH domain
METQPVELRRARYVRTLLVWHGKTPADLAERLRLTVDTIYKKLDGRRAFTTSDLLSIADWLHVDAGLLLLPPDTVPELGVLTSAVESAWIRTRAA